MNIRTTPLPTPVELTAEYERAKTARLIAENSDSYVATSGRLRLLYAHEDDLRRQMKEAGI